MPNRPKSTLQLIPYKVVPKSERGPSGSRPRSRPAPRPPAWLPPDAAAIWRSTARAMRAAGTWRPEFEALVAMFSLTYAELQRSPENFQTYKLTQLRLLAGDLGMSPQTHGRLKVAP